MISTYKSSENTGRIGEKWSGTLKGADVGNKVQRLSGCKEQEQLFETGHV